MKDVEDAEIVERLPIVAACALGIRTQRRQ
jgi:hypothetical protein